MPKRIRTGAVPEYRAYDIKRYEVFPVISINYKEQSVAVDDLGTVTNLSFDDVMFTQNTGFKDRHDKEIFVNDIVHWQKVPSGLNPLPPQERKDIEYIRQGESGLFHTDKTETPLHEIHGSVLVIGNIYENLELLEEAE